MERRLNRRKFVDYEEQRRLLLEDAIRSNKNAKLERVLGCTACSSSIAVDPVSGLVAYPCGSTVVINNPKGHTQAHLVSSSKNNITCLAFSPNGRYVVTGEFGQDPMVRVWELQRDGQPFGQQAAELKEYKFGVACVIFSRDSNQIISVGNQHDKSVVVWDWRSQRKIAESRVSSQVNAMAINESGKMFVTVGCRHVKFWFLESANQRTTLQGRSGILSDHRNNTFIDVCCAAENRTFAITVAKNLVEFHDKKLMNVYEMNGDVPYSLTMGAGMLFVGFGNGRIRALDVNTAAVLSEAPLPHYLKIDLNDASDTHFFERNQLEGVNYPDCHSLVFHEASRTLTAFYSDRSVYHWQFLEAGPVVKVSSHLFHVNTVHDLCIVKSSQASCVPAGTFFTCGADETVRMWSIEKEGQAANLPTNVLSSELRKILYLNAQNTTALTEPHGKNFGGIMADTLETTVGIRCLCLSHSGRHLAVGGRNGNITIFDLHALAFSMVGDPIEAHENEVRCLEYSNRNEGRHLLASGSRDRLVHLFDVGNGYAHLFVIEDHSSTVYSVKFIPTLNGLQLITCSTDKIVVVRQQVEEANGELAFERVKQLSVKNGPNYLVVTPDNNLLTAGSDRHIRSYSLGGKELSDVNGTLCDGGTLTKIALDPSGTFAATVCSDRYVYVVDVQTGDCAAVLSGQTDGITSIEFTSDCRRLIVVSFSGCVFVWRLSNVLTKKMSSKLAANAAHLSSARSTVDAERCTTPDSLIESGSDSASAVGKKEPRAGSEEFGSLNSLTVVQEASDLDSGVGLRQQPAVVSHCSPPAEQKSFVVRRVPAAEVVRRSTSNLQAALASSRDDLHAESRVDEQQPAEAEAMNSTAFSPSSVPAGYAASRSMSNLHRQAVSPPRSRRRWAVQNAPTHEPPADHQPPPYVPPTSPYFHQPHGQQQQQMGTPHRSPYAHQQHVQPPAYQPGATDSAGGLSRFAMSTSMSLNAIRSDLAAEQGSSSFTVSAPYANTTLGQSPARTPLSAAVAFDRNGHSRNSLSKRYLSHAGESPAAQTVWTPPELRTRQPAGSAQLFSPASSGGSSRRLSSVGDAPSGGGGGSRLYQPRLSNMSGGQSDRGASRNVGGRLWQRRSTVANGDDLSTAADDTGADLPTASAAEMFNTLRSRSQSPSQLALQQAAHQSQKLSATLQRRRDSDARSTNRLTPSSSRSNLRAVSNLGNSSQALNKLLATREQLKKSQENLLLAANAEEALGGSDSTPMSRSRSIGNLKFSAVRPAQSPGRSFGGGLGAFVDERQMTRSVSSLHHDDPSLRSQYGDDESGGRRQSNVSRSIRDLRKLSNPDLTAEDPEKNSSTGDNSTPEPSLFNVQQQGAYYSTTLPKRKGAVQKRVERSGRLRLDQTTSGDSDSNASDAANFGGSPFAKAAAAFQRTPAGSAPFRSVSSMDATRGRAGASAAAAAVPRRGPSYLAQRLNGGESTSAAVEPTDDAPIPHDSELTTQSAKGMKMHVQECFEDVKKSVDKLIHAKSIIEKDAQVTEAERERLLRSVFKQINQFRARLDAALPADRTFSDLSYATGGSGSLKTVESPGRPSNFSAVSAAPPHGTELNADFLHRYGPQLMALLEENMARKN